jgi:hypothetical protein
VRVKPKQVARVLVAVAGLAAVHLAAAPPAGAVPGLVVVSATKSGGSIPLTVAAICPAGTVAVGGSYEVESWMGTAVVSSFGPLPGLTGYQATGYPPSTGAWATATPDPWYVTAYAECGDSAELMPAAATAGMTRLTTVTARTDDTPAAAKRVSAACPDGSAVLGTGATVTSGRNVVLLDGVVPDQAGATVSAHARPSADPGRWSLIAEAVCATPAPDTALVTASTGIGNGGRAVSVACPEGSSVHGAGMQVLGDPAAVLVHSLTPVGSPPTTLALDAGEGSDQPGRWGVRVVAVCAR